MLRISKLTDYATVIMSFFALSNGELLSATYIAEKVQIALPTVSKILKKLCDSGLVVSTRGASGGYRLAKSAEVISIADVLCALEGPMAMTECCMPEKACNLNASCSVKSNWQVINKVILNALGNLKLSDMVQPLPVIPARE